MPNLREQIVDLLHNNQLFTSESDLGILLSVSRVDLRDELCELTMSRQIICWLFGWGERYFGCSGSVFLSVEVPGVVSGRVQGWPLSLSRFMINSINARLASQRFFPPDLLEVELSSGRVLGELVVPRTADYLENVLVDDFYPEVLEFLLLQGVIFWYCAPEITFELRVPSQAPDLIAGLSMPLLRRPRRRRGRGLSLEEEFFCRT